ncbi:MAG TPA: hypothetical protein VJ281_02345 [Chthoniobacterales bacterium]|jgi:hypothetical protein|nr:hypothetical protein [Chthoniobacterales bacterium]
MKTAACILTILLGLTAVELRAQDEPNLIPDVVDPAKLIPILPEPPSDWTAEKAEGSSDDVGGFKITNVHRDYRKGAADAPDAPTASISILDSVANPDYVEATSGAWKQSTETPDGYSKPVTIDGNVGFEAYEKDQKHASLWVMVAKRYFVEIELQNQEPKELQEWIKKVDLKKLAEIKK